MRTRHDRVRASLAWFSGWLLCIVAASGVAAVSHHSAGLKTVAPRTGERDFDSYVGGWTTRLWRLEHLATDRKMWVEYDGTYVERALSGRDGNVGVLKVDGTAGHIEALLLRRHDPATRQWRIYRVDGGDGILDGPFTGQFDQGHGTFIGHSEYQGKAVLMRIVISLIASDQCRSEWAYSEDDGESWNSVWVETDTRIRDTTDQSF